MRGTHLILGKCSNKRQGKDLTMCSDVSVCVTQVAHLIIALVLLLCCRVYPCDHSQIPVDVRKYCAYHRFMRLRHCTDLDE